MRDNIFYSIYQTKMPEGQQLGLMIFSSDRDFTLWPDPGTELTVDLAQTELSLPVVGGADGWKKALTEAPKKEEKKEGEEKKSE